MHATVAKILSSVGRTLIGAGVLVLLFVVYQLWGTNIHEAQAQKALSTQFATAVDGLDGDAQKALAELKASINATTTEAPKSDTTDSTSGSVAPPPTVFRTVPANIYDLVYPKEGEPLAVIKIPKIGLDHVVVEGTNIEDLKKGPGHYLETPLPGQKGNAAIAGHRTTFGAPFSDLDRLEPGDEIRVETVLGTAVYKVNKAPFIVQPTQVEVVDNYGDNRLTLTACHPKLSAAQRIVVTATLQTPVWPTYPRNATKTVSVGTTLVSEEAPTSATVPKVAQAPTKVTTSALDSTTPASVTVAPATEAPAKADLTQGLAGDRKAIPGALGWGAVCTAIGLLAYMVGRSISRGSPRRRLVRLATYTVACPFFLFFLYLCFTYVDRLLPAY